MRGVKWMLTGVRMLMLAHEPPTHRKARVKTIEERFRVCVATSVGPSQGAEYKPHAPEAREVSAGRAPVHCQAFDEEFCQ